MGSKKVNAQEVNNSNDNKFLDINLSISYCLVHDLIGILPGTLKIKSGLPV